MTTRVLRLAKECFPVRFDDSLKTVLSAEARGGFGAEATWRQLVDLMGRGRIPPDEPTVAKLRLLRAEVPDSVRAGSARALAFTQPPARLVGLFAEDTLAIAAPVLRTARLDADQWLALLPRLTPSSRSVLRHRRDLPPEVERGLESFGAIDFVLDFSSDDPVAGPASSEADQRALAPEQAVPAGPPNPVAPLSETPFVSLGSVALGLPVVAEALRRGTPSDDTAPAGGFAIADVVARIDAFQRTRGELPAAPPAPPAAFRFETDAAGAIRWVDGVARAPLVGVSLEHAVVQGQAQLDGIAAGAFRRRSAFSNARLEVSGRSDAAGSWRISAVPAFDSASGRFTGFRGSARRPRADEVAARSEPNRTAASESLRQLVHELRTPTTAIAGFAELIETELLGAVAEPYRGRAGAIRRQASDLLAAIDDLDMAARIEGEALELHSMPVHLAPLVARVLDDLAPLARLRGATVVLAAIDPELAAAADDRALERLIGRLLSALVSACGAGERIAISAVFERPDRLAIAIDRPAALALQPPEALLHLDAERELEMEGAPLLGTGFALRIAQNLAAELGGALEIGADRLVLRMPAASRVGAEQVRVP